MLKIAIIGTRGIPNNYGGFEQFAEYLSIGLVAMGVDVTVYNSHNHPHQSNNWHGVKIVHCYDPEEKLGTIGQFIYDFNCILNARKKQYDVILQLGYTSSSIWSKIMPKKAVITTNMDGLEWKRTKYSRAVQLFLKWAEKWAVSNSDYLISDSIGIQKYLQDKYKVDSNYIPYGANVFEKPEIDILLQYNIKPYEYNLLIARLEPENSIETILDGVSQSNDTRFLFVVGNVENKYGRYIKKKYNGYSKIVFCGPIYNIDTLNNLRFFSHVYFHGHTVGGTNPSLLEAMASSCLICAHSNVFNRSVLGKNAYYFNTSNDVTRHLDIPHKNTKINEKMIEENIIKIKTIYSWKKIVEQYLRHFENIKYEKIRQFQQV